MKSFDTANVVIILLFVCDISKNVKTHSYKSLILCSVEKNLWVAIDRFYLDFPAYE